MIERDFDISFIAGLSLREKQIQQNYRPVIAVHKWFARRPGALFRGLLLSEFCDKPIADVYYSSHSLDGIRIADPFMGGGTPLLEANRTGCDVVGVDINPMSYWIVREEILRLDLRAYDETVSALLDYLEREVGFLHRTRCVLCGAETAQVKYFLWVKTVSCRKCGRELDLFPGYLVARDSRHPKNVIVCHRCGELIEVDDRRRPGTCPSCGEGLVIEGPARRGRCTCWECEESNPFPAPCSGPPRHRLFAIEYYCSTCRQKHRGRFFKRPDSDDLEKVRAATDKWAGMRAKHVPDDEIPVGDETNRLHRWGYTRYREMFNARQLLGLELSARFVAEVGNDRVRNALATNLSDLLRYQNMLCRYDTTALKSLDIFSVHGFPVGLIQCESGFLGISEPGRSLCVGSGGWANIVAKFRRAKAYCDKPFEILHNGRRKKVVPITGEWIGEKQASHAKGEPRRVELSCGDAGSVELPAASLDAVFTDPPYFGNVQYAELMDFCYVWLRRLVGKDLAAFAKPSTRDSAELTGNESMGRGLEHFAGGLSVVFRQMARALKPGSPLAFTYHHNDIRTYYAVAVALLDSELTCSASLPCPAEMGASIHISGTRSSIIDTVFVCRSSGRVPKRWIQNSPEGVAWLVEEDLGKLKTAGVRPSDGDIRCVAYGHLIRLAVWSLRGDWQPYASVVERIKRVEEWLQDFGGWAAVSEHLGAAMLGEERRGGLLQESASPYGGAGGEIPF